MQQSPAPAPVPVQHVPQMMSRSEQRRLRLLEIEREQSMEEAEAFRLTEAQRQLLLHAFRSVKIEFSDLDGMTWTPAALRTRQQPHHSPNPTQAPQPRPTDDETHQRAPRSTYRVRMPPIRGKRDGSHPRMIRDFNGNCRPVGEATPDFFAEKTPEETGTRRTLTRTYSSMELSFNGAPPQNWRRLVPHPASVKLPALFARAPEMPSALSPESNEEAVEDDDEEEEEREEEYDDDDDDDDEESEDDFLADEEDFEDEEEEEGDGDTTFTYPDRPFSRTMRRRADSSATIRATPSYHSSSLGDDDRGEDEVVEEEEEEEDITLQLVPPPPGLTPDTEDDADEEESEGDGGEEEDVSLAALDSLIKFGVGSRGRSAVEDGSLVTPRVRTFELFEFEQFDS